MTLRRKIICGECGGTGKFQSRDVNTLKLVTVKCQKCKGSGKQEQSFDDVVNESLNNYSKNPH
jgi:DnaJ-class molecular chaperone